MNLLSPELLNLLVSTITISAGIIICICLHFQKQQKKIVDQLRIKVSADLHDEVGALLTGIAMQAELLELQYSTAEQQSIQQLALRSRQAMAAMRDVVWSLDARKDNWNSLLDRLREFAMEVLEPKNIAFEVNVAGIDHSKELPTDLRKHLYLIGKEAITNVAKHSDATCVIFCIQKTAHQLNIAIQDNGRVPEQAKTKTAGLGLSNIGMRAKALGAQLNIVYQNGFGINLNLAG